MCIRGLDPHTVLQIACDVDELAYIGAYDHLHDIYFRRMVSELRGLVPDKWSVPYGAPLGLPNEHCSVSSELWGASFGRTHGVEVMIVRDVEHQPIFEGGRCPNVLNRCHHLTVSVSLSECL